MESDHPANSQDGFDLTRRQKEVLALVLDGRFAKEIAAELGIRTRTAEKHIEHLGTKFAVRRKKDIPQPRRKNT